MTAPATDAHAQEPLRGRRVVDVMLRTPRLLPAGATLGEARRMLEDDHVHLVLLVDDGMLLGTLDRSDATGAEPDARPAAELATLHDRTVPGDTDALVARDALVDRGARRRAVVDADGRLLGLLCLKRSGTGFCSDQDVSDRSAAGAGVVGGG